MGDNPDSRNVDRVPVFKPGELLYVAFTGLRRSEPQTLEALRMRFKSLQDRSHNDSGRMKEWGPESQKVAEEWIAVVLQLRRSLRLAIVKVRSGELVARRVLANVFIGLGVRQQVGVKRSRALNRVRNFIHKRQIWHRCS